MDWFGENLDREKREEKSTKLNMALNGLISWERDLC